MPILFQGVDFPHGLFELSAGEDSVVFLEGRPLRDLAEAGEARIGKRSGIGLVGNGSWDEQGADPDPKSENRSGDEERGDFPGRIRHLQLSFGGDVFDFLGNPPPAD